VVKNVTKISKDATATEKGALKIKENDKLETEKPIKNPENSAKDEENNPDDDDDTKMRYIVEEEEQPLTSQNIYHVESTNRKIFIRKTHNFKAQVLQPGWMSH